MEARRVRAVDPRELMSGAELAGLAEDAAAKLTDALAQAAAEGARS